MDENFLLSNDTAISLFHDYAKNMPIFDYHCHLNPKEILEDKSYKNLTEIWLYGDHYKWRAMRANGIDEKYITGDGDDYDKFLAFARTIPYTIGNPLYHWAHLELQRYFDIYEPLNEANAKIIWDKANERLKEDGFTARGLLKRSKVKLLCTTDDPLDDLSEHESLAKLKDFDILVLPTYRPDKGVEVGAEGFRAWAESLEELQGKELASFEDYLLALEDRAMYFHERGCRISDHGLEYIPYVELEAEELDNIYGKARLGESLNKEEIDGFKTAVFIYLGKLYGELGWTMQLHLNAIRNNNTRLFESIGPDTGFDSIHDHSLAYPLSRFLDALERDDLLPKTILYSLNPKDDVIMASMAGNFQGDGIRSKIQHGSAWWFNDQLDGMTAQIKNLANMGLLSRFVGMLTDSRSFLSFTRHEYFRRLLCNILGEWVENGEVIGDMDLLGEIVRGISYNNARDYFGIDIP